LFAGDSLSKACSELSLDVISPEETSEVLFLFKVMQKVIPGKNCTGKLNLVNNQASKDCTDI